MLALRQVPAKDVKVLVAGFANFSSIYRGFEVNGNKCMCLSASSECINGQKVVLLLH
jgi:hypothetical protein